MALFIGRLSSDVNKRDLEDLFKEFGEITRCDVKQRYAFVTFADDRDAKDAKDSLDGKFYFLCLCNLINKILMISLLLFS
jgi:RNA recognition motif-containing protein